ncbi:phosphomannomutase/phosphoglucomutase [Marivibrio halodurans]|uniref:Phosphomannomutase/phosphoglucomutase n=1 Tax=Marivibrio halodurans TaxID=2039722 RepID=A0A8J7SPU9_9PROT|nr:phosphomannomutase/phosphoglucomutase [Marivibrio halodurans]
MPSRHQFAPSILRAYDVRGVYGDTLTRDDARALGAALASEAMERGGSTVVLGRDGRASSPTLSEAVAEGLASTGATVHDIGRGPTPMLYYASHSLRADAAIMVTGSHNPPDYNGFKMMLGEQALMGEEIQALGRRAAEGDFRRGRGTVGVVDLVDAYCARLHEGFHIESDLSCAWDPGHGAVAAVLDRVLSRLPGAHLCLNNTVDPTFPAHHPDPGDPDNLAQLIETVRARQLDMGFAFDGDGDRLGVVDRHGRIVWPDQLLVLLADKVLRAYPGQTVIADVKASQMVFDEIAVRGGKPLMWKTGHSLIKAKMRETGAPLAGEMSGHIFFADRWPGFDDALYAALRLIEVLDEARLPLDRMVDALPVTVATPEIRIECADETKFDAVARIAGMLKEARADVVDIDGVRVNTPDGWWLLRASNTQPALVARCEGGSAAALDRLKRNLSDALDALDLDATSPYLMPAAAE